MKKILTLILAFTMSLTMFGATGCKEEAPQTSAPVIERLELEKSSVLITLGDKVELPVSYNALENGVLTWTSSSPNVVSVDENGYVEGLRTGTATVTAHYGTKTASCKVEVALAGNVPSLVFDSDVSENITLAKGTTFDLGTKIRFNGKTFDDGEIEYFVMDQAIGAMEDGSFVTKNVAGSTQVTVFATWRGQTVHSKTITVNVIGEKSVLLNGGRLKEIKLYTAAQHGGESYLTAQTVSDVYITEDGTRIEEYDLSVLDEGIASIEKKNNGWEIKAIKSGKTNLIVSYGENEFPFEITVKRPVFKVEEKMEYSVVDGKCLDEASKTLKTIAEMFDGFEELVSYEIDGTEYEAVDGKIEFTEGKDRTVTVYNETVGYELTFDAYTMLVDELSDFEKIYAGDTTKDLKGTYVLVKDIIEPNTVLTMPAGKVANNFAGIFDGRGHVLSFTFEHGTVHRFGLFGDFLKGAIIKNVALDNITMDGTTGKNTAGIICGEQFSTFESTIENVFVNMQFSEARDSNLAFMGNAMWKTIMKNVIIHVPTVPVGATYGSFARGDTASVSNSYVISSAPTYVTTTETSFRKVPTLYATYAEMLSAGNDYSSFSSEYWDVTTHGIPVWKTLAGDFVL